jgi:hypothetical protein
MRYRLYSHSTHEPCDTIEMHVLARAYRAAWRSLHGCEPQRSHVLAGLDLLIEFDELDRSAGAATPRVRARGSRGSR